MDSETAGSNGSRIDALLGLYRSEAVKAYEEKAEKVTSKFAEAGRLQCAHHIRGLSEAAEAAITGMIIKVRQLNHGPEIYAAAEFHALATFDELSRVVRAAAIGPNGRMPSPANGEVADRLADEARGRIKDDLAKWRLEDSLRETTATPMPDTAHLNASFDAPRGGWLELWQGPLRFRATYDQGKFGPGHSFDDINKLGLGRSKDREIYTVRADPTDSAIVIEWQVGLPGRKLPEFRYYDGRPGRDCYDRLRSDGPFRKRYFAHLPPDMRDRAVGAYATAVTIREWLEGEFFNAIREGQCEIWARVGSKVAPFRRIPADIFRAYKVKCWGYGSVGAARAELEGAEPLFAIHVAPNGTSRTESRQDNNAKGGRPPEVDWDRMKRLAEDALKEHPEISRSKLADSLVSEYADKTGRPSPVKRTIERKLASWALGATKPVSS